MAPDDVVTTVVYSRACTMLLSHLMFFAQFPDPALRFLLLAVWESCCRLHKVVAAGSRGDHCHRRCSHSCDRGQNILTIVFVA